MISGKLRLINSLNWKQNLATISIRLIADFSDDHDHYNLITNDGCFLGKGTYNNLIVTNRGILYENIKIRSWASRPLSEKRKDLIPRKTYNTTTHHFKS